jgi:hypothetical protein
MQANANTASGPARAVRATLAALLGTLILAKAGQVSAATIEGSITGTDGEPLYKVPVCLKLDPADAECHRIRTTDQGGQFRFNGIKDGTYTVEVFQDPTASGRKFEIYRTYVWAPKSQTVSLAGKNASGTLDTFMGKFNFSNYQRVVTLTAADFPELSTIDYQSEYVALKVFVPSGSPDVPPETIYLGQVTNPAGLAIEASLPLAASTIGYEIFSISGLSLSGSIILADG